MKLNKDQITKFIFWPLEIIVILFIIIFGYLMFNFVAFDGFVYKPGADGTPFYYSLGMILGIISFSLFSISILPGMLTRYGIKGKLIKYLTIYRRETGKLMFLFAFAHYLIIKTFPMIAMNSTPTFPLYQTLGFIALVLTTPLFLTSNNFAQKKMGRWWKRLHRLVYIIVWLVFLHVALVQGLSLISAIIFLIASAELLSLINYHVIRLNLDN